MKPKNLLSTAFFTRTELLTLGIVQMRVLLHATQLFVLKRDDVILLTFESSRVI